MNTGIGSIGPWSWYSHAPSVPGRASHTYLNVWPDWTNPLGSVYFPLYEPSMSWV